MAITAHTCIHRPVWLDPYCLDFLKRNVLGTDDYSRRVLSLLLYCKSLGFDAAQDCADKLEAYILTFDVVDSKDFCLV